MAAKCSCKKKTSKIHEAKKRASKAKTKGAVSKAKTKVSKLAASKGCRC